MTDNLVLHTDLYQINMMQVYFEQGISERNSVFEVYFRDMPFKNGYVVFAGLERVVDYLRDLHFGVDDITYLRELGYPENFLDYLTDLRFTCDVRSAQEGISFLPTSRFFKLKVHWHNASWSKQRSSTSSTSKP
jgi:nicotinate phosphoribosyltransferase